jgi:hypothetical protein
MNPLLLLLGVGGAFFLSRPKDPPLGARATVSEVSFAWTGAGWFPVGSDFQKARERFQVGQLASIVALGETRGRQYRWDGEAFRP